MAKVLKINTQTLLDYSNRLRRINSQIDDVRSSIQSARTCTNSCGSYPLHSGNCQMPHLQMRISASTLDATLMRYDVALQRYEQELLRLCKGIREMACLFDETERRILLGFEQAILTAYENIDGNPNELNDILNSIEHITNGYRYEECAYDGDPVNMATGNFVFQRSYLECSQAPHPIQILFTYNAQDSSSGIVGPGWSLNYAMSLTHINQLVCVRMEDGHEVLFHKNEQGGYTHSQNESLQLSCVSDGYVLTRFGGQTFCFDSNGRLTTIERANLHSISLHYKQDQLISLDNGYGNGYHFTYKNNRLVGVEDAQGRVLAMHYGNAMLCSIDAPLGRSLRFSYHDTGKMASIVDECGVEALALDYDTNGRVIQQRLPQDGRLAFSYHNNQVVLTYADGKTASYEHDDRFLTTRIQRAGGDERFEYDSLRRRTARIDPLCRTTRYAYDNDGNCTQIIDAANNDMRLRYLQKKLPYEIEYNGCTLLRAEYENGQVKAISDGLSRIERYEYDHEGQLISFRRADGSVVTYSYNERGDLVSVTDEHGACTHLEYDALHRMTANIDARGNKTCYEYNDADELVKIVDALGQSRCMRYDLRGNLVEIRYFDGSTEHRTYDCFHHLLTKTDVLGRQTIFDYDAAQRLVCRTDPNGGQTRYFYNSDGQLSTITDANGHQQHLVYDLCGNLIERTAADGGVYTFAYDELARPLLVKDPVGAITHISYNQMGKPIEIQDAAGGIYRAEYDIMGQLLSETAPNGHCVRYTYHPMGFVETASDNDGLLKSYEYYPGGLLKSEESSNGQRLHYRYDACANLIELRDHNGCSLCFEYDELNRLVKQTSNDGACECYTYDAVGRLKSVTDALGQVSQYTYTLTGKLDSVVDAKCCAAYYSYDAMDRLSRAVRTSARAIDVHNALRLDFSTDEACVTSFQRDLMGLVRCRVNENGTTTQFTYDACGRVTSATDGDNLVTRYGYHSDGTRASVSYADGRKVCMEYTPLKQLSKLTDWMGEANIQYDEMGQPVSLCDQRGDCFNYSYNTRGQRTQVVYPNQTSARYDYDEHARLSQISFGGVHVQYSYNQAGLLESRNLPHGITQLFTYDVMGRMNKSALSDGTGTIEQRAFRYDLLGRRCGMTLDSRDHTNVNGDYTYQYDEVGALLDVIKDGALLESYRYDVFGNRVGMQTPHCVTTYAYNAMDQLVSRVYGNVEDTFCYDGRGNLTQYGADVSLSYDAANRLTGIRTSGEVRRFDHDGFGMRVQLHCSQMGQTDEMELLVDRTRMVANVLGVRSKTGILNLCYADDLVLSCNAEDTTLYLSDLNQTLLRVVSGGGMTSFGASCFGSPVGASQPPIVFGGYVSDGPPHLYHANKREYCAELGRFSSPDPYTGDPRCPQTLNHYAYCGNDPVNYYDPSGCVAVWLISGIVGTVKRVVTQVASDTFTYVTTGKWEGSVSKYVGAAAGGFAEGVVYIASGCNSTAAGAAGGATESFVNGVGDIIADGNVSWESFGSVFQDAVRGGVSGASAGFVWGKISIKIPGITSGRGNWDADFRRLMTSGGRRIIRNASVKAIIKGITTQGLIFGGLETFREKASDYLQDRLKNESARLLDHIFSRDQEPPISPRRIPLMDCAI